MSKRKPISSILINGVHCEANKAIPDSAEMDAKTEKELDIAGLLMPVVDDKKPAEDGK